MLEGCKPDHFEPHNSVKLKIFEVFVPILLNVNLSLNQTLLTFLFYVRQTLMTQLLTWFWQFLCEGLSYFHQKRFYYSYAWSCILCEGRTSFCMWLISRKLCRFLLRFSPSTHLMCFVLGDFNVHHKDWLTYFGRTDRLGELYYNFSISNDLTQIVHFPTQIPDYDSHSPVLLDLFISSRTSICSTMAFLPLKNSDHVVVSVSTDFPINSK